MSPASLPAELVDAFAAADGGPLTVDITTTGRTSGLPRRIEIWVVKVGDRIVIGGTPGPRGWFANLVANPDLTVHLKGGVVADVEMSAAVVADPVLRQEIWSHPATEWYRNSSSYDALIADAPTVELTPRVK